MLVVSRRIHEVAGVEHIQELVVGAFIWDGANFGEQERLHVAVHFDPVAPSVSAACCAVELNVNLRGEGNNCEVAIDCVEEL